MPRKKKDAAPVQDKKTTAIRLLVSRGETGASYVPGDVIDVPTDEADRYVEAQMAEYVK